MSETPSVLKIGADQRDEQTSLPLFAAAPDLKFERPDWVLFRSVATLSQKAGVPTSRLRRLVIKELVDNALDAGATEVQVTHTDTSSEYVVLDNGRGLPGTPEEIARLFSINRPMITTKLWRKPLRGALGNGLRVVTGAVAASQGGLKVWTRNQRLTLTPREDGGTDVFAEPADFPIGTTVELMLGRALPLDMDDLSWGQFAIRMAAGGSSYEGKPSPYWYDADHWYELLQAAGDRPVRELLTRLDGCTGAKAGKIAAEFKNTRCNTVPRGEATELLKQTRALARPVSHKRLGAVGPLDTLPGAYAIKRYDLNLQEGLAPQAELPVVIEAWADALHDKEPFTFSVCINRSPITGHVTAYGRELLVVGCGLNYAKVEAPKGSYRVVVNLTSPYVPITTDGKEPDLAKFASGILEVAGKAMRTARRQLVQDSKEDGDERITQKSVIEDNLEAAIAMASGDGEYRFSLRQLYYAVRPAVLEGLGKAPSWGYFQQVITDHEAEHGEITGMYRDARGTLYTPHTGQEIALGTLAVEQYERPAWTFNKILFIEKEGFFEVLKAARWPERHDCALVTSKGYATRAIRDLLDGMADTDEPVMVFCAHDADAFGGGIFQALQDETKARPRRRVEVVNLGLEPWEGLNMGLPIEPKDSERSSPIARYVLDREDGDEWAGWLQDKRIELNAMTSPQFMAWLDAKMGEHETGKVIPPERTLEGEFADALHQRVREVITERILREARMEERVMEALGRMQLPISMKLTEHVEFGLQDEEDSHWRAHIESLASDLVADMEASS